MDHDNAHQPSTRETLASAAINALALALMMTAGYFTSDLLAAFGR